MKSQNDKSTGWLGWLFGGAPTVAQQLTEARQRVALAQAQRKLRHLELTESLALPDWITDYSDYLHGHDDGWVPWGGNTEDRRYGANYPFFLNIQQHAFLRQFARLLVGQNPFAGGMLEALTSYIVGEGFTYRVTSKTASTETVAAVQETIDAFRDNTNWWQVEREAFSRSRRDGEFFLRWFGGGQVRFVEPEYVTEPAASNPEEWSFGIRTDPEDVQSRLSYWITYEAGNGEEVPADQIIHHRVNVDSTIKRGVPDFSFGTREILDSAHKLLRNMAEGSAIQAAIAEIQQFESATESQVTGFADEMASFDRTNPFTQRTERIEKIGPGTIRRVPRGTTYVPPPYSQGIPAHVSVFESCLRTAAARWNAPEWVISSNAGNMGAYTSSLVAESPFVKRCRAEQKIYGQVFCKVLWLVIDEAIMAGKLPSNIKDLVTIQVEGPMVETRNTLQQAQVDQIYIQSGIKSRQTVAQDLGLDWEQEQINQQEYNELFGQTGGPLPLPGDGGPAPNPFEESKRGVFLDVPREYQDWNYSCGAAAVVSVASYLGIKSLDTETEAIKALGTSPQDGTSPEKIIRGLRAAGVQALGVGGMGIADLQANLDRGRPVIVSIQTGTDAEKKNLAGGHYVTVVGYDSSGLWITDPVNGLVKVTADDLLSRWIDQEADGTVYKRYGVVAWK